MPILLVPTSRHKHEHHLIGWIASCFYAETCQCGQVPTNFMLQNSLPLFPLTHLLPASMFPGVPVLLAHLSLKCSPQSVWSLKICRCTPIPPEPGIQQVTLQLFATASQVNDMLYEWMLPPHMQGSQSLPTLLLVLHEHSFPPGTNPPSPPPFPLVRACKGAHGYCEKSKTADLPAEAHDCNQHV